MSADPQRLRALVLSTWLLVIVLLGTLPAIAGGQNNRNGDARKQFLHAILSAVQSRHLRIHEEFDYATSGSIGSYGMEISPGRKVNARWELGRRNHGRIDTVEGPFKSHGIASAAALKGIVLNILVPGITRTVAHPAIHLLQLEQYRITGLTFSTESTRSSTIISVHGRGYPWQCALDCGASAYIPQVRISEEYAYSGRLVIDARTHKPVRYISTRAFLGHTYPGQVVTFKFFTP